MMNQPVRVVRSSGTIVSATVSIGYDVSRHELEELFVAAGTTAELEDPFVQVLELGDHSVAYRIAGFLDDPTRLLAARSRLRGAILDVLSEGGIEIMSPIWISRRAAGNEPLLPDGSERGRAAEWRRSAEDRVFDKAEIAAQMEQTRIDLADAIENLDLLNGESERVDDTNRARIQGGVARQELRIERLERRIERLAEEHRED